MCEVKRIEDYKDLVIPVGSGVIYEYTVLSLDKSYIGQTTDLHRRHMSHCTSNKRIGPYLRHGDYNLSILDIVPIEELDKAEMRYIRVNKTYAPFGFNESPGGRINDLDTCVHNTHVPRMPIDPDSKFKSRVYKIDGRYYLSIPNKVVKRDGIEPDDLMDIWAEYTHY